MSAMSLRLPNSLHEAAKELARREGMSESNNRTHDYTEDTDCGRRTPLSVCCSSVIIRVICGQ